MFFHDAHLTHKLVDLHRDSGPDPGDRTGVQATTIEVSLRQQTLRGTGSTAFEERRTAESRLNRAKEILKFVIHD